MSKRTISVGAPATPPGDNTGVIRTERSITVGVSREREDAAALARFFDYEARLFEHLAEVYRAERAAAKAFAEAIDQALIEVLGVAFGELAATAARLEDDSAGVASEPSAMLDIDDAVLEPIVEQETAKLMRRLSAAHNVDIPDHANPDGDAESDSASATAPRDGAGSMDP